MPGAERAEVVICGAGIAGISAAYHLAVRHGVSDVLLVDERPPLTLTSDKSTECYRNWWPGPGDAMVRLMDRGIDLLEELARESDNFFALNRRGYAYLTADLGAAEAMERAARATSALGAGPLRVHRGAPGEEPYRPAPAEGFEGQPEGADLILDRDLILELYPFLSPDVVAMLNPRRAGWLSAQQLGMYLLERAREHGARLVRGRIERVVVEDGRVAGVEISGSDEAASVKTPHFVDAAGPMVADVARLLGVELPVFNELHAKVFFTDHLGLVPRDLPLVIWNDPIRFAWSEEERHELAGDPELAWLLGELPGGVHFRPEGGEGSQALLLLWAYDAAPHPVVVPPSFDPIAPDVVLRGLARMVPALGVYLERARRPYVDGGYYCKTRENRPLVGPLPVAGAWVLGALSGYGIMASQSAAELLAAHLTGAPLPAYAPAFALARYDDPAYRELIAGEGAAAGQL